MPFQFKRREPVAKAVRRMCSERIEDALETLKDSDHPGAVHSVRKEIKKLRAIFRLMRGEIGKNVYRRNNQALRAAAGHLTAIRDAHVKLDAFEGLVNHFRRKLPARPFPEIKKALQENCREQERKFLKSHSKLSVGNILRELKASASGLKTDSQGWAAIKPGLKKSYCRGQEAFAAAKKDGSPEHLHEWRKRVKDIWFHLRLLGRTWPKELNAATDDLERLGELLGDDHDLVMLAE
jgi:CHAD domain-containing protein